MPSGLVAVCPVKFIQRCTATSTYVGLISMQCAARPVISAAMIVVPLPTNGSYTAWPGLKLFSIGRFMHSTGFCVLWPVSNCAAYRSARVSIACDHRSSVMRLKWHTNMVRVVHGSDRAR